MKSLLAERKETKFQIEKVQLEESLNEILGKNKLSNKKIREYEKAIESLDLGSKERELSILRNEFNRIERDNKNKDIKRNKLEKSLEQSKKEFEENVQALNNWKKESEILNKKLSQNEKEISDFEASVTKLKEDLNSFTEIQQLENKKKLHEKNLVELMNTKEIYMKEYNQIKTLEERFSFLKSNIQNNSNIENTAIQRNALESEIKQIKMDMEATLQEIARRKQKIADNEYLEQTYKREKEVIKSIKDIKGVYGFVKDLGSYDKGYEAAIEASTKAMSNIAVDTSETAEKCISVILKKKLNRTTFIIMDKLSNALPVDLPDNIKAEVLYKKIKCDKKFEKLFYFAFKDTLCVSDLEEAKKLAFGKIRRKVVTLDGKLLEKSGIMSGGKVSKKIKSAIELEEIYKNMNGILESKIVELSKLREQENQRQLASDHAKELEFLKKEIEKKHKAFDSSKLQNIEQQISSQRTEINTLENIKIPSKAIKIREEIKTVNEKIDFLHKLNLEIKMSLGLKPSNIQETLKKDILKIEHELDSIVLDLLPDTNKLNILEDEYNSIYKTYKEFEEQIQSIRSLMGDNYHQEAQLKSKLEDTLECLKDCAKIKNNCLLKKNEILNEFTMTRNLLNQIDPSRIVNLDTNPLSFDDLNDQELKEKSKEMIEELNVKEAENFKRLKSLEKGNEDVEEDLEIYRIIFSEFNQAKKIYDEMKNTTDFTNNQLSAMKSSLEELKNERLSMFLDGYNSINRNIKEIFSLITFGGNAELDLLDYLNPFAEGIVLNIMPPKKAWKQISNLSGGEKTLSSLGLIFALHKFKPSSLYIMDEIDAALDYKNVSVISQYLSHVKSQFIIISLRNDMFEMAKTLIGVYKYDNISKTVTVDLNKLIPANQY